MAAILLLFGSPRRLPLGLTLPHDTSYSYPSLCQYSGLPTLGYPRDTSCNHTTSGSIGPLAERACQGLCEGRSSRGRRRFREVESGEPQWRGVVARSAACAGGDWSSEVGGRRAVL